MQFLDSLTITSANGKHTIELYHGDLTAMQAEHAVDVLVVSANPGSYVPARGSLIKALADKGISVRELAKDKYIDLLEQFSCWLSHDIVNPPAGIHFKRIMSFETARSEKANEVVGDIFQALMPFVYGEAKVQSLAMPLLATRRKAFDILDFLEALLLAASNWFLMGVPVTTLKIVEFDERKAYEAKGIFRTLKRHYEGQNFQVDTTPGYQYDLFISYSHKNTPETLFLHDELLKVNPNLRIYIDQKNLDTGSAWQQSLYEALDNCQQVVTLLSPHYLLSKVCKEEFNIALARHRELDNVLVPVYLYSAPLPTYMQMLQFLDCREFNKAKLKEAASKITQPFKS
jgi:hypothetical protein